MGKLHPNALVRPLVLGSEVTQGYGGMDFCAAGKIVTGFIPDSEMGPFPPEVPVFLKDQKKPSPIMSFHFVTSIAFATFP